MAVSTTGRRGASVLMKYFGKLPGQNLSGFADELKQLSDEEFAQLLAGIEDETFTY